MMMNKGRIMESEGERVDEDLSLFRELRKRQNERVSSLLHSTASEDYEYDTNGATSGKFALYRIPSAKKEYGLEYLVETNKNEYDWLKTPPATPLFPSLEMEPNAQLVVQKEIPISQPISRLAGNNNVEALKPRAVDGKPNNNTNSSNKAKVPTRSITPSHNRHRPTNTIIIKNTKQQQPTNAKTEHNPKPNIIPQKQSNNNADLLFLNHKKSMEAKEIIKPKTRGISPSVRSRVESNMVELELPNEAPPNLRTEKRASSTTRGRSTTRASKVVGSQIHHQDAATITTPRSCIRPSRSPSPSVSNGGWNQFDKTQKSMRTQQKERFTLAAGNNESGGVHFVGSKIVEKVVKARKSGINHQAEKETKPKPLKNRV